MNYKHITVMDSMAQTSKQPMTCTTQRYPDRINQASEVVHADKMVGITTLKDDQGNDLPEHFRTALTSGTIAAVVVNVNGKHLFLQPFINTQEAVVEQQVPSTSFYVRDEETQEPLWRLATVAGGQY